MDTTYLATSYRFLQDGLGSFHGVEKEAISRRRQHRNIRFVLDRLDDYCIHEESDSSAVPYAKRKKTHFVPFRIETTAL